MNSLIQTIDITERKKIEDILRSSEEKYRFLTNNMNDIIWTMDMNFNTTYVSPSIETVLGFTVEERMKQGLAEQITPDSINKVKDIMIKEIANEQQGIGDSKKIFNYELDFNHKNGSLRTMEIIANKIRDKNGAWIGILGVSRDITERKQSEEALRNLQKLESLGVLAGGIAHDFNNLLGGIFGYIDLASSVSTEKEVIQYLNESLSTINRARALTNQLLTFSKGGAPIRKTEHLMPIIRETVQFALSGSNISHTIEIDKDLWPCYIDKNQISQVIDNIIINSLQAMPMGGKIEVTAKNIRQGNKEHSILQNTQYVKVSIKDFGIGIPKEIKPFIFDPFFTTKTKGHGLGLATSFSIVNRHEGLMDIESTPGKGTTFHIFLPASQENAINEKQKTDVSHKGSGTIIVMDDEEFIRNTLEKMLNSQGYNCVLLKDGSEVLDFFQAENKSKRQITGLILDLTIPGGLGGREIVSAIRKIDPKVPILVISGYADDPAIADPAPFGFTASIGKPFTIAELSAVLEKHLKQD
jgi:PAS domain S-box-containing protein